MLNLKPFLPKTQPVGNNTLIMKTEILIKTDIVLQVNSSKSETPITQIHDTFIKDKNRKEIQWIEKNLSRRKILCTDCGVD